MTPEEYLGRVQALAWQAAEYLPRESLLDVSRLIEHGEPAEGMCYLAWAIVKADVSVPREMVEAIRAYTEGLVDDEFLPPNLDDHILPTR